MNCKKLMLVGNHDYHFVRDDTEISSPNLSMSFGDYVKLWDNHPIASEFINDALNIRNGKKKGLKVVERIAGEKVAYVHGSLKDDSSFPLPCEIWGRIFDNFYPEKEAVNNFEKMNKHDYWLLFRGHDHVKAVFGAKRNSEEAYKIGFDSKVFLKKEERYIISVPSFKERGYAIFDDENLEVEFGEV